VQKDATKKGVTWKKQEGRTNEIVAGTWRPEIVAIVLGNPETHPM
jgi:predicted lysophospholipase L1 biosynthesis ABC-type transport system permease subunit